VGIRNLEAKNLGERMGPGGGCLPHHSPSSKGTSGHSLRYLGLRGYLGLMVVGPKLTLAPRNQKSTGVVG
jgi:hypothetical protein